jgi:starch phosphorylase
MLRIETGRLTLPVFQNALRDYVLRHRAKGIRAFFTAEIYDGRVGGGGLGTLSADWLKESADQGLPVVGISFAYHKIIHQKFINFWQHENFVEVKLEEEQERIKLPKPIVLNLQGKEIPISVWARLIQGREGVVPVFELSSRDCGVLGFERITEVPYPGKHDWFATLGQELILGIGGVKVLKELNIPVELYHLNDGHPAFVAAAVLQEMGVTPERFTEAELAELRKKIIYTSHTLVGAAADMFFPDNVSNMITDPNFRRLVGMLGAQPVDGKLKGLDNPMVLGGTLDMAGMAMFSAGKINAVSQLNAELFKKAFPQHEGRVIGGITNAVHPSWAAPSIAWLYEEYVPHWKENPEALKDLDQLRNDLVFRKKFWEAHLEAKVALVNLVADSQQEIAQAGLDPAVFGRPLDKEVLTVGFARRVAAYKRHDLLAYDLAALVASFAHDRPIQFVFAGKAHPMDNDPGGGKWILQNLLRAGEKLNKEYGDRVNFVFLPNYDVVMAKILIPGVDLWLNNPIWGLEASGTSTMDAILNGVPLLTTDDGCVPEMRQRGDVGWIFGRRNHPDPRDDRSYHADAYALYAALSAASEAYYYGIKSGRLNSGEATLWMDKMINAAVTARYFLTARMVGEYQKLMWGL